jgi:hypothetical protein
LVPVECDVFEARRRRSLGLSGHGDMPAVRGERLRDGRADIAGAAEDEGAPGYRL